MTGFTYRVVVTALLLLAGAAADAAIKMMRAWHPNAIAWPQ